MPLRINQPINARLQKKVGPFEVYSFQDPFSETGYGGQLLFFNGRPYSTTPQAGLQSFSGNQIQRIIEEYANAGQVDVTRRRDGTSVYEYTSPDRSSRRTFATREEAISARNREFGPNFEQTIIDFRSGRAPDPRTATVQPIDVAKLMAGQGIQGGENDPNLIRQVLGREFTGEETQRLGLPLIGTTPQFTDRQTPRAIEPDISGIQATAFGNREANIAEMKRQNGISLADMRKYGITGGFTEAVSGGKSGGWASFNSDLSGLDARSMDGYRQYLIDTTGSDPGSNLGLQMQRDSRVVENIDPEVLNRVTAHAGGPQNLNLDFTPERKAIQQLPGVAGAQPQVPGAASTGRIYRAGDPNPYTGRPMSQMVADRYNQQQTSTRGVPVPIPQQSPASGTITTAAGLKQFNTGDPGTDRFLNQKYLPAIQQELANDPSALYDEQRFKEALSKVDAFVEERFGPVLRRAAQRIEQTFGLQRAGVEAGQREFREEAKVRLSREEEDKLRGLAENARNFDEAKLATQERFRQRGLTFSGLRAERERALEEERARKEEDIERTATRSREDVERQLAVETGQTGRRLEGLGLQQQEEQERLAAQRREAIFAQRAEIRRSAEETGDIRELFL